MGLIKCPDCGKEVSDKANVCINCGFPIEEYLKEQAEQRRKLAKQLEQKAKQDQQDDIDRRRYDGLKDKRNVFCETKEGIISIHDGRLKVQLSLRQTIEDYIWYFSLEYFAKQIFNCYGLKINNAFKGFTTGVYDVYPKSKQDAENLMLFKEIMENNGFFNDRNRFDAIYRKTSDDKCIQEKQKKKFESLMGNDGDEFKGIYRYDAWSGRKTRIYCPSCHSDNCSWYVTEKTIPGKTKTTYKANLNPLKPFTLYNKKEKVIRKESQVTKKRIICNSCGRIFD
nr:MAG TPA: zinc-ribbon containing domain protein [Caudoviricetes sp.]